MTPAATGPSAGKLAIVKWLRRRPVALLAIPLAVTTMVTPFASSPFHTTAAPVVLQSSSPGDETFFGSSGPRRSSTTDGSRIEVGLRFRANAAGNVSAIRFYKNSANRGTHVGNLWDESGNLLGSVTFTQETSRGWQLARLPKA